ncbi:hypothetical protein [Thalassobacillus pellis]|uniref:hypothetical protein n=1 Tax=Thalassobacillus pellis TaxID=748008 RepID=UPI0019617CAC|nr:hypothetical protein [Thalassobacillus pellis]MBM7554417.1 hypothetical protein [Thalassobacillus pellis]
MINKETIYIFYGSRSIGVIKKGGILISLTSMLKSKTHTHKEFQTILREALPKKKSFRTISGHAPFSSEYQMIVPYTLTNPYKSFLVGIAFDYLARIMIAKMVKKNKEVSYINLTAEKGLTVMKLLMQKNKWAFFRLKRKYIKIIKKMKQCINGKKDIESLIPNTCFLAKLEQVYRSGMPPMDINKAFYTDPESDVINDLKQMCHTFQRYFLTDKVITPYSEVIYNPNFGVASSFVGGADGDIFIDGTLYDFKSGKSKGYKWQEVAQLVGYFLLNELSAELEEGFLHANKPLTIKRIAFYRARYGEIEYFDISSFHEPSIEQTKLDLMAFFKKQ